MHQLALGAGTGTGSCRAFPYRAAQVPFYLTCSYRSLFTINEAQWRTWLYSFTIFFSGWLGRLSLRLAMLQRVWVLQVKGSPSSSSAPRTTFDEKNRRNGVCRTSATATVSAMGSNCPTGEKSTLPSFFKLSISQHGGVPFCLICLSHWGYLH